MQDAIPQGEPRLQPIAPGPKIAFGLNDPCIVRIWERATALKSFEPKKAKRRSLGKFIGRLIASAFKPAIA